MLKRYSESLYVSQFTAFSLKLPRSNLTTKGKSFSFAGESGKIKVKKCYEH